MCLVHTACAQSAPSQVSAKNAEAWTVRSRIARTRLTHGGEGTSAYTLFVMSRSPETQVFGLLQRYRGPGQPRITADDHRQLVKPLTQALIPALRAHCDYNVLPRPDFVESLHPEFGAAAPLLKEAQIASFDLLLHCTHNDPSSNRVALLHSGPGSVYVIGRVPRQVQPIDSRYVAQQEPSFIAERERVLREHPKDHGRLPRFELAFHMEDRSSLPGYDLREDVVPRQELPDWTDFDSRPPLSYEQVELGEQEALLVVGAGTPSLFPGVALENALAGPDIAESVVGATAQALSEYVERHGRTQKGGLSTVLDMSALSRLDITAMFLERVPRELSRQSL